MFPKIPIQEAINIIRDTMDEEIDNMVSFFLNSAYFSFQGSIYEQTDGISMASLLSLVIANLYMEIFEKHGLDSFPLKLKLSKHYVDDMNIIFHMEGRV